ncbi:MAG: AIM24 family protein [Bacillota bacterium]|nr:AIM24 family protein [Bacillota bacterium]
MFNFTIDSELTCKASGNGSFIAKKGAMIAYTGDFKFEKLILGPDNGKGLMGALLGHAVRSLTGENIPLMNVTGSGDIYLARNAYHVSVLTLESGDSLSVESENLLAFSGELKYTVRFLGIGVLSQKGLATTLLTNESNSPQQVAIITDGNCIMLQTPCTVDPDALVCWTGSDPAIITDTSWKTFIGQSSGESYQFRFHSNGDMVVIQPSERLSGLKVSID